MTTLVLGLGHPDRGDDAVGLVVATRLATRCPALDVRAWTGSDLDLLEAWAGHDRVVVVDAARSTDLPGTCRRRLVGPATRERWRHTARPGGSHALGLVGVVGLGHALGRLPDRLEVVTIEVDGVTAGADLSPAVAVAADRLVGDLVGEFARTDPDHREGVGSDVPG